jgi:hypothetical protein
MHSGSGSRNQGVKKPPNPGSGSATMSLFNTQRLLPAEQDLRLVLSLSVVVGRGMAYKLKFFTSNRDDVGDKEDILNKINK